MDEEELVHNDQAWHEEFIQNHQAWEQEFLRYYPAKLRQRYCWLFHEGFSTDQIKEITGHPRSVVETVLHCCGLLLCLEAAYVVIRLHLKEKLKRKANS